MKLATLVIQLAYYLSLTAIDHLDTKCNLVHPRGREKIIFFVIKTSPLTQFNDWRNMCHTLQWHSPPAHGGSAVRPVKLKPYR